MILNASVPKRSDEGKQTPDPYIMKKELWCGDGYADKDIFDTTILGGVGMFDAMAGGRGLWRWAW